MPNFNYDPFSGGFNQGGMAAYLNAVSGFAQQIHMLHNPAFAPVRQSLWANMGSGMFGNNGGDYNNPYYAILMSNANPTSNWGGTYWNNNGYYSNAGNPNINPAILSGSYAPNAGYTSPQNNQNAAAAAKPNTDNYTVSVRRDVTGMEMSNLQSYDANNNKRLDGGELKSLFDTFDVNTDGLLDVVEYNEAATFAGIAKTFNLADGNHDQGVNVAEFDKLLPSDLNRQKVGAFAQVTETAPLPYKNMPQTLGLIDTQQGSYNDVLAAKSKTDAAIAELETVKREYNDFMASIGYAATTNEAEQKQKELEARIKDLEEGYKDAQGNDIAGTKQLVADFEAADKAFKAIASQDLKGAIANDMRSTQGVIAARVEEQRLRAGALDATRALEVAKKAYEEANEKLTKLQNKYPDNEPKGKVKILEAQNSVAAAAANYQLATVEAGKASAAIEAYVETLEARVEDLKDQAVYEANESKAAALNKDAELLENRKKYIESLNTKLNEEIAAVEFTHTAAL